MEVFSWEKPAEEITVVIGFELPPDQRAAAVALNGRVSEVGNVIYRYGRGRLPYIRFYEAVFVPSRLDQIGDEVREAVRHLQLKEPPKLEWANLEITTKEILLWGHPHEFLQRLQLEIAAHIESFRVKVSPQDVNFVKTNWPWMTRYEPYVVVAEATEKLPVAALDLEWKYNSATLKTLFIASVEPDGKLAVRKRLSLV